MEIRERLELKEEFGHSDLLLVEGKPIIIIKASANYIPIEEFKELFAKATELIESNDIKKVIFDKRRLQVFHQPSMEWYYVHWKDKLLDKGISTHRKLLPDDPVFNKSVELGKVKIREKYPNLRTGELDIQYYNTLQDAIDK